MEVIATRVGTYGRLREVGERFTINDKSELGSWMAPVGSEEAEGVARQREPIATPARAETGPNPAIAHQYAEAGFQTTALLMELQDARVTIGELKTQVAETEALRRENEALRARLAGEAGDRTAAQAEKATEAAIATAREDAAEQLQGAVEAANEAREDDNRSEQPEEPTDEPPRRRRSRAAS